MKILFKCYLKKNTEAKTDIHVSRETISFYSPALLDHAEDANPLRLLSVVVAHHPVRVDVPAKVKKCTCKSGVRSLKKLP